MIYIYGLKCPVANVIRYVGKTTEPEVRLAAHMATSNKHRHYTGNWLLSLKRRGLMPTLVVLQELDDSADWESVERDYIARGESLGWKLTNTTPGGEGGGFIRPEDKERWRNSVTESLQAPEVRERISSGVRTALARPATKAKQRENMARRWVLKCGQRCSRR